MTRSVFHSLWTICALVLASRRTAFMLEAMYRRSTKDASTAAASYRHVLSCVPFLFLWAGVILSYLTDRLVQLGLLELVRPTVENLGAVNNDLTLFMMLPFVFLSPLAGPLIDRLSRRAILIVAATAKAAILLVVVALLAGRLQASATLLFVYAVVAVQGVLTVFFSPARTALVPQLIESRHLLAANSLMNVTGMFMMLIGNFVAAGLLAAVATGSLTLQGFFVIAASIYMAAVALFALMRISAAALRIARSSEESYLARLRGGLRYAATHRVARGLIALAAAFWLVAGAVYTVVNGKLLNEMGLGTDEFGYVLGTLGLAIFAGGFALTFGSRWLPSVGATVRAAFAIVGLSVLWLAWVKRFGLLFAPVVLIGLAGGALVVLIITTIQRTVPRRTHGRLFSLVETCQNAALILALVCGRVALELVELTAISLAVSGLCLVLAVTLGPRRRHRLTNRTKPARMADG